MSSSIPPEGNSSQGASAGYGRPAPIASDELLPPVEAPSARFILQLFVIPALIVAGVVGAWFVIESLARRDAVDPDEIVRALRSSNQARFQRANELADMLRTPERYPQLKTDRRLAEELAKLLDECVAAGSDAEAEVTMRYILATMLGEFYVDDGLPALIKTALDDPERDVRRKAINSIAVLAGAMASLNPPEYLASEALDETLLQLADEQDDLLRSETAFALAFVAAEPKADPRLAAALEELADDLYTDARFNAALGLARINSPRAAAALAEMFDVESLESSMAGEKQLVEGMTERALRTNKAYKRDSILHNAIAAVGRLQGGKTLTVADRRVLADAIAKFLKQAPSIQDPAPIPRETLDALRRTQAKLEAAASAGQ